MGNVEKEGGEGRSVAVVEKAIIRNLLISIGIDRGFRQLRFFYRKKS